MVATLAIAAPAMADEPVQPGEWESAPIVQRADFDAALEAAQTYWSRVPGVPSVAQACGTLPGVQVIRSDMSSGYGLPRRTGPCRLWLTDTYLAANAALPAGMRYSKALCPLLVHELGHALGLGHDFTGDPAMVMSYTFDGIEPAECSTPAHEGTQTHTSLRACVPAWATATARVTRLYGHGRKALARRVYRKWQRTHKARARNLTRACGDET